MALWCLDWDSPGLSSRRSQPSITTAIDHGLCGLGASVLDGSGPIVVAATDVGLPAWEKLGPIFAVVAAHFSLAAAHGAGIVVAIKGVSTLWTEHNSPSSSALDGLGRTLEEHARVLGGVE